MCMNRAVIALILALFASPACAAGASAASPGPDFAWGGKFPAAVKTPLKLAEGKWREAASVPTSPQWLKSSKNKSFDETYMREILGREGFAYDLLDVAMTKLKRIDECRSSYAKAVSAAGSKAPAIATKGFDESYYLLKSRIRLAIGLARAEVSREMMGDDESGYCFQAMESAVDALRDAAIDAEKAPGGAARAERIRKFRTTLFDTWEAAERSKDTNVIGGIDLPKAWDGSGLSNPSDKNSKP